MPPIRALSSINLGSLSQRIGRLGHYVQARFHNRFGPTCAALARFIPRGCTILDIGANHGKFARQLALMHGGSCSVLCFEPLEYNYTLLTTVVRGLPNVRVARVALSSAVGEAEFYIPVRPSQRISPGAAHLGDEKYAQHFGTATAHDIAKVTVATDTLDHYLTDHPLSPPFERLGFIKMDVQGAERLVLQGAAQTLTRHRPPIWCELCTGQPRALGLTVHDSVAMLRELGYELHRLDERTGRATPTEFVPEVRDYLCLHREARAE